MKADTVVVLGSIALRDFEVPEKIPFGGRQIAHKHTLIGGARVVDTMGPDPHELKWKGRFRGADAVSRAQSIERLMNSGRQVTLSWGALVYQVIVHDFEADYERFYELPYHISCMITDVATDGEAAASLGDAIASDMSSLNAYVASIPQGPS